jgi:RNA polymerase sigma factor (sigma-70 family)
MAVRAPRKADLRRVEDRQLAALAAAGDEWAFEAIFERHHRGLLSLCRHLLGSIEEAEDALQHTFAAAYRQLAEREPPEHLRAWLYTAARNRCLDVLRTRRELPSQVPPASTAGLSEEVERRSDLRELVDDIGRLPEDQRAALVMSEIQELRHDEVAQVLGCRREKVRALVYQARSSLSGWREARALPCREVRQELVVARGGALRRGALRRHLKLCTECAAFRKDVDRQRRRVALVLPVLPSLGLKERILETAWGAAGAGGGSAAAGGAAAGGGLTGSLGATGIKVGAAVLVLGGGVATFGGLTGVGPGKDEPSRPPAWEHSAASERRDVGASRDRDPLSASKGLLRPERARDGGSERTAVVAPGATGPGQPEQGTPVAPQAPDAAPPSAEAAPPAAEPAPPAAEPAPPSAQIVPALPQDRVGLPDAEVEAEVEVEVDPPVDVP